MPGILHINLLCYERSLMLPMTFPVERRRLVGLVSTGYLVEKWLENYYPKSNSDARAQFLNDSLEQIHNNKNRERGKFTDNLILIQVNEK